MSLSSLPMQARTDARSLGSVFCCVALTALCARLAMHVPFTPVPVTWQVAAVLFSGLILGARRAFYAQAAYLFAGLLGAPVFAFGHGGALYLFNPNGTGGYLLSYPLAAWLVGFVVDRWRARKETAPFLACACGLGVIYGLGCLWLGVWLRLSLLQALVMGAGWFLAWDIVKALIVIAVAQSLTRTRAGNADKAPGV